MSRRITFIKKCGVLFFALMIMQVAVKAATFTAVASGNFSSAATWGGTAPSTNVLLDNIIIPSGVTVNLDQNLTINGLLSSLDVNGTLTSSSNSALILTAGTLSGAGTIDVDSLVLDVTSGFNFTGSITADDFSSLASGVSSSADVTVTNQLWLAAGSSLDFITNGSLTVNNNATIVITGNGLFTSTTGSVNLTGNYSVLYNGGNSTSGLELTGTGLQSVTVDLNSGTSNVILTTDMLLNGTLSLQNGSLVLSGNDLVIGATGNIASGGSGFVVSTSTSNIAINAATGTSGAISFSGNTNAVGNLAVNVGAGNTTAISGTLSITAALAVATGTLNISGADIILSGTYAGNGNLYGNANTDLSITTATGLSTPISFAANGEHLDDLNINTGTGTIVSLGSDLTVHGTLSVAMENQFDITDVALTVMGGMNVDGSFTVNSGTSLAVTTTGIQAINFTGTNATIGSLLIDGSGVDLTGDLTVDETLSLQGGRFDITGQDLTINGNIALNGTGYITSTSTSNLAINTGTALNGGIRFSSNSHVLNNLTVNVGTGNSFDLYSDLNVTGTLNLQGGTINVGIYDLTLAAGATVTGASSTNYVVTSNGGNLVLNIAANSSGTFAVGTSTTYAPAVIELNSGMATSNVSISVQDNVLAQGLTGTDFSSTQSVVDATWFIETDATANINLDMELWWSAGMEVNSFNRSMAYVSHYTNSAWDATATANATAEANGMFSIRREGITSLSPFAVFDNNTVTGIKEAANAIEFNMFPVPANNTISFTYNDAANTDMKVDILDVQGSVLGTYELGSSNSAVSISNLASGTYLARVYNNNVNSVQRFTKL